VKSADEHLAADFAQAWIVIAMARIAIHRTAAAA